MTTKLSGDAGTRRAGSRPGLVERPDRLLARVGAVGFALAAVATLMVVVGDPIWNLYVVVLGWFAGLPVAIAATVARQRRRRR